MDLLVYLYLRMVMFPRFIRALVDCRRMRRETRVHTCNGPGVSRFKSRTLEESKVFKVGITMFSGGYFRPFQMLAGMYNFNDFF